MKLATTMIAEIGHVLKSNGNAKQFGGVVRLLCEQGRPEGRALKNALVLVLLELTPNKRFADARVCVTRPETNGSFVFSNMRD